MDNRQCSPFGGILSFSSKQNEFEIVLYCCMSRFCKVYSKNFGNYNMEGEPGIQHLKREKSTFLRDYQKKGERKVPWRCVTLEKLSDRIDIKINIKKCQKRCAYE